MLPTRIPWIPRIQLWYQARKLTDSMPEKWKDHSLREVERELRIGSPARLILHGTHLSSQMTPPPLFDRYILPYYREFMPLAHENQKKVAMHADADVSLLLDRIRDAGWDMVECFVTSPMDPLTLEKARKF